MRWIVAGVLLGLAACARSVDMVPLNPEARVTGIPKMDVTLYGTGYGPATATMPSGEVLNGHYRLALAGTFSNVSATAVGPRGAAYGTGSAFTQATQGNFTLQATGANGTTMVCSGTAGGMGHGDAVCIVNGAAQYQMMF